MKQLYFILFFCATVYAQEINIAKDTIRMKEVVIKDNFSRFKSSKVKIKGNCESPETMKDISEIVTLADRLPHGYFESVSLYFNEMHYTSYKSDNKKFEDTEFEVVLYKVKPDNTPGERIMKDEKYIKIMKEHTGKAVVHFLEFNIKDQPKLFIGIRRTENLTADKTFYVDCVCEDSRNITFSRNGETSSWSRYKNCPAIKMEINVLVSPE